MDNLEQLQRSLKGQGKKPPLHLWDPKLSGDIDIVIRANGEWFHQGVQIKRKPLVKLFSSILRQEHDGDYYLLTPVEKWRITVEAHAFVIVAAQILQTGTDQQQIIVTTNIGEEWLINTDHPLVIMPNPPTAEQLPCVQLDNMLSAKINRAVYYQLAELTEEVDGRYFLLSDGVRFEFG